ncbi:MAG TPA: aspartoacylase [Campylobacterales bacterium]|nr:aspartoacylase [Campylobacterales bacterium]
MNKKSIKNVVIVGGTHGNEFTGVFLAKYWIKNPDLVERNGFDTKVIFANQKAFKEVRRYIDRDLNRSCSQTVLTSTSILHEELLAKDLNSQISSSDFIVDLHTTTSNMGLSLVVSNTSELTWLAASHLNEKFPDLKIYRWQGDEEGAFVDSLGVNGFAIEVGAVPQGVLRADLFEKTKELVYALLDFLNGDLSAKKEIEIYDHLSLVDFPRDSDGEITAMVHPKRQDMDFKLINPNDPMFLTFDGKTIVYKGSESLYGLFINEAAYYEKGFAMCLARKIEYKF